MSRPSSSNVHKPWYAFPILVGVLLLYSAGCTPVQLPAAATPAAPAATSDTTGEATAEATAEATEEATMTTPPAAAAAPEPVRQALADLAARLAVSPEAIEIVQAEAVVWPDGSLGCPEPDMMYTQVIVEGMKIILAVEGEEYHYHYGDARGAFLCENPVE